MDLIRLEHHLKKCLDFSYSWGSKQNDADDKATSFIYKTRSVEELQVKIQSLDNRLKNYALNRWLNFWSAKGVETIFCQHRNVVANLNQYDKLVDFTINGIPFDHKTSVFPNRFGNSFAYAQQNKRDLIQWLYDNQSQQGRKHHDNRLFIVLFDQNSNDHWKIKTEIALLKQTIDHYLHHFNPTQLEQFDFGNGTILSDIIWCLK
jgi:hypothetical protein